MMTDVFKMFHPEFSPADLKLFLLIILRKCLLCRKSVHLLNITRPVNITEFFQADANDVVEQESSVFLRYYI